MNKVDTETREHQKRSIEPATSWSPDNIWDFDDDDPAWKQAPMAEWQGVWNDKPPF